MKESQKLFKDATRIGLFPTKQTYTSMICGYCRSGDTSLALNLFHRMSEHDLVPDSIVYGAMISGLCKDGNLDEAYELYIAMVDKGLSPCEVTRVTLAYEYCMKEKSSMAISLLDRLDKKSWIRTVTILVRKLCYAKKVDVASMFLHKLIDKDRNVDYIVLAGFMTACYESNNYAMVSEVSRRISKSPCIV